MQNKILFVGIHAACIQAKTGQQPLTPKPSTEDHLGTKVHSFSDHWLLQTHLTGLGFRGLGLQGLGLWTYGRSGNWWFNLPSISSSADRFQEFCEMQGTSRGTLRQ